MSATNEIKPAGATAVFLQIQMQSQSKYKNKRKGKTINMYRSQEN